MMPGLMPGRPNLNSSLQPLIPARPQPIPRTRAASPRSKPRRWPSLLALPFEQSAAARPPDQARAQEPEAAAVAAEHELAALRLEQALLARRAEAVAARIATLECPPRAGAAGPSGSAIYVQGVATTVTLGGSKLVSPAP
jgi:hypothetical protein